jgi:hypothetical protein
MPDPARSLVRALPAFAILLLAFAPAPLAARPAPAGGPTFPLAHRKHFALEIIVFRELDPSAGRHEIWPTSLPKNAPFRRAITLASSRAYLFGIEPLPPSLDALDGVWQDLVVSAPYHPVLHTGWIVPGLPISVAPYLAFSGKDGAAGRVVGAVRLSLNRYLHAAVDAYWIGPPPAGSSEQCPHATCVYPLVEAMKIPPGGLVYFDNPRFGVLLEARLIPRRSARTPG